MKRALALAAERLAELTTDELAAVAGAAIPTNPCPLLTTNCPSTLNPRDCLTGQ